MRRILLAGGAIAGCTPVVTGDVRDDAGQAVAGAVVHADGEPPCDAVTDDAGRWRTRCAAGAYRFEVRHPDHAPATAEVTVGRGREVVVPTVTLHGFPEEPGLHIAVGEKFTAPAPAPLARAGSDAEGWRWCVTGTPEVSLAAGTTRLLDNHVADWRLLRADAEGCVYRMKRSAGDYWSYEADRIEVSREAELAPGRVWLSVDLTPGTYVVADWVAGGLVPEGDGWRAGWFTVTGP